MQTLASPAKTIPKPTATVIDQFPPVNGRSTGRGRGFVKAHLSRLFVLPANETVLLHSMSAGTISSTV